MEKIIGIGNMQEKLENECLQSCLNQLNFALGKNKPQKWTEQKRKPAKSSL